MRVCESAPWPMRLSQRCGSAFKNKGVQSVLMRWWTSCQRQRKSKPSKAPYLNGDLATRRSRRRCTFCGTSVQDCDGFLCWHANVFPCLPGVLKTGDQVYNPIKDKRERIGRMVQMHANNREEIKEVRAGDIAAAIGLKDVTTGETLCSKEHAITLERMEFPIL